MNSFLSTLLLGLIQGFTEFLPISSTGHVLLVQKIISEDAPPLDLLACVTQFGSILALMFVYGKELTIPLKDCTHNRASLSFLISIAAATIPAAVLGFMFRSYIKNFLYTPETIAFSLISGGFLFLYLGKKTPTLSSEIRETTPVQASIIGMAQAIALIPGVSRSGATIASGIALGYPLERAIDFSFILAIPTLFGASIYQLTKFAPQITSSQVPLLLVSFIVSALASFIAIGPLIRFVKRKGLAIFGYYRIALGILLLIL
jgi:undecaprenyl-diphosphatase